MTLERIGILGGTFDPPHIGHLLIAEEAAHALDLDEILFVPASEPPHKLDQPVTSFEHRVNMLRIALRENPVFVLSLVEATRPGPSYTVDTIRELRDQFPAADLFFIMGEDSLAALPTWHDPLELVKLCKLAVLQRPGYDANLDRLDQVVPGVRDAVVFIHAPEIDISSSELQARIRAGRSIGYLVPCGVAEYIDEHGLYR